MIARRNSVGRTSLVAGLAAAFAVQIGGQTFADVIALKSGGSIRGKVLPGEPGSKTLTIVMDRGKTPLSFRKDQVESVSPEPSILDDYLPRRLSAEKSSKAEEQFELANWCRDHKLLDLASVHAEAALSLDPGHDESHQLLGHTRVGDRWLNRDELRQVQGLVKHKGKWITVEEKERQEASADASAEEVSWTRRLKILHAAVLEGAEPRRTEAEQQLRAIRDERAVRPLLRTFGREQASIRTLLVNILGQIPGPAAGKALVDGLLGEIDPDVRQAAMTEIGRRKDDEAVPRLTEALRSKNVRVVNRAAWALGNLKATGSMQRLIAALTTVENREVWVPTGQGPTPASVGVLGAVAPPPASVGGFQGGLSGGGSYALLQGPQVGPGVVAFGATALPLGLGYGVDTSADLSAGRGPMPVLVPYVHRNVEVLGALVKLTGQDFGYDPQAWRRWVATSFRPEAAPVRTVPQP